MRHKKSIIGFMLLTLFTMPAMAQETNRLYVGDVSAMMSTSVDIPVYLENTNPNVVGVQLEVEVPEGVTLSTSNSSISVESTRMVDHRGRGDRLNSTTPYNYRFIVLSPTNKPFKANRGKIFSIRASISDTAPLEEGSTYDLPVRGVIITDSLGQNVMTSYDSGHLTISANPDFTVSDIQLTSSNTVNPSDEISVSWTVNNIGSIGSQGGWSEQISLVSTATGESNYISTQHYNGTLESGASVVRSATMTVPRLVGLDGSFKVQVKIIPNSDSGERAEYQSNNTTQSASSYTMLKKLYLSLPGYNLTEGNNDHTYGCYLERSGSRTSEMSFTLTKSQGSDRVTIPSTLTISKNSSSRYFYLTVHGNNELDELSDTTFVFNVASANGYEGVSNQVIMLDDEHATITLTPSQDELNEGDTFTMEVRLSQATLDDLKVSLSNSKPSRFTMPNSVIIPAGASSSSVNISVTDDNDIQDDQNVTFTATAYRYDNGSSTVLLKDDDMPVLNLTLTPTTVSESAGPTAIQGRLTRSGNMNTTIRVRLTTSNSSLYLPVSTITMNKGVSEAQFSIGVVDNADKEGDREAVLIASVYLSSCNCQADGTNGGMSSQTITILDDDGAALTLSASNSNMLEGSDNNVFTVRRNDSPDNDLTVSISASDNTDLSYPSTVTIPAGSKSATFTVSLARNEVSDDSRTITFTASHTGYSTGTCWVQSTDQTLPDIIVSAISVQSEPIITGHEATVTITVENKGYAPLPAQSPITLLWNGSTQVGTLYTKNAIAAGENETIVKAVKLSDQAGTFSLLSYANYERTLKELNYSNNSSERINVTVDPLFSATLSTSKAIYNNYETIIVEGTATGLESRNAAIEVYFLNGSTRISVETTSDSEGRFTAEWTPEGNLAGTFEVGACCPGENVKTSMRTINILGMRNANSSRFSTNELEVGETVDNYIDLFNHGSLPLTGIHVEVNDLPEGVSFTFGTIPTIAAGGTERLTYSLTGLSESTSTKEWQTFTARLVSSEGAILDQTIYYVVYPSKAVLKSDITNINTTMIKGQTRTYPIVIRNEGRKETGAIHVDLGNVPYLSLATPKTMASLAQFEEATIVLELTPTAQMDVMSIATGNLFIGCENGSGQSITYRLETVSENTGTLVVDVWDEFTYNTDEAPHVEGATVTLKHPVTQRLLHQFVSGSDGLVTFNDIEEGTYIIEVTHPKHKSYKSTVLVNPGTSTTQRVFIEYSAITVTMTYEKTEIEDEYEIVTTVTYETNVPKPVVVLDIPKKIIMADQQLPYTIYAHMTNVGLVTAKDATLRTPDCNNGYVFTPLITDPIDILPQQTLTIPVQVTKASEEGGDAKTRPDGPRKIGPKDYYCGQAFFGRFFDNCKKMLDGTYSLEEDIQDYLQLAEACNNFTDPLDIPIPTPGPGGPGKPNKPDTPDGKPGSGDVTGTGYGVVGCDPWLTEHGQDAISGLQGVSASAPATLINWGASAAGVPGVLPTYKKLGTAKDRRKVSERITVDDESVSDDDIRSEWKGWLTGAKALLDDYNGQLHYFEDPALVLPGNNEPATLRKDEEMIAASPSWWKAFINKSIVALYGSYHNLLYSAEVLGDVIYTVDDYTELSPLVDAVSLAKASGKSLSVLDYSSYKPDWLSDDEFSSLISRLYNEEYDATFLSDCKDRIQAAEMQAQRMGYASTLAMMEQEAATTLELLTKNRSSVCSKVKLQINQKLTMTRQAVRGTLTVVNGSNDTPMQNITLNLVVTDPDGTIANSRIMEIHTESLEKFTGDLDYESGWNLAAGETGVATILFIPTKYAAPTEPLQYTFSGSISFVDPFTGLPITRELESERLTVTPSPNLDLTYFMQRDIFGDDPLTKDVVEPMVPSQFSLLINNKGYGDATNVKMLTNQPEIVDNEKGLLVEFEILSSQLNGGDKTLAMGSSVTTDFGTIPAHSQTYAQWWLTSTLTGHFIDYDVQATHITSYDNPDLSLLDNVTIHELIHQIKIPTEYIAPKNDIPIIGFMANDEEDSYDKPDMLYISDGTMRPIYETTSAQSTKVSDTEYTLHVMPSAKGWNYGNIVDPTGGSRKIKTVTRQRDNIVLPSENFWQTDRTLLDMNEPIYENLIHFADSMALEGENYTLEFEAKPSLVLAVSRISGLPENNSYTQTAVDTVIVNFNKIIDEQTFTTEDITVMHQGERMDLSTVKILKVNDTTFKIDINKLTTLDGYYSITIQCADIEDIEGFCGESGKTSAWIQVHDGKARLTMVCEPEGAGVLTPGMSDQDFFGSVEVSATANEGYTFMQWRDKDDAILNTNPSYTATMNGPTTLRAIFQPKSYDLTISYNELYGTVKGGGSGRVEYNQMLTLTATPKTGFYFAGWYSGETLVESGETLTLTIHGNMSYEARFLQLEPVTILLDEDADNSGKLVTDKSKQYTVKMNRVMSPGQWNPFCAPMDLSEQQINKTWGYYTMIMELKSFDGGTLNFGYVFEMKAGHAYLVQPERKVLVPEFTYKGNLVASDEPIWEDFNGYSYRGIYSPRAWESIGSEYYFGVSSNKLIQAKTTTVPLKGLRAYFVVPLGGSVKLNLDGVLTGIEEIEQGYPRDDDRIYTPQGTYMGRDWNRLPQGIYIINGEKYIKR